MPDVLGLRVVAASPLGASVYFVQLCLSTLGVDFTLHLGYKIDAGVLLYSALVFMTLLITNVSTCMLEFILSI